MKAWRRGLAIMMILAMGCTGTPVSHAAELPGVQAVAAPETQPADPAPDPEEGVTDPAEWDGEEDVPAQEEEPAADTDDQREDAGDPVPGETDTDPADHVIAPEEFADALFYAGILERFDADGDGYLSVAEAGEVTEIDVSGMEITDLGGIGSFPHLETLDCSENELNRLDLSANAVLLHLNCGNNRLTSLDLSGNLLLETLDCSGNRLTLLDIRANTALTECVCDGNTRDITITGETFDPAELDPGFDPGRASDWTGASWDADRRLLTDLTGETITYRYEIGGDRYAAFTLTIPENEESSMEQAPGETAAENEGPILGVEEETEGPEILMDPGDPVELSGTYYPTLEEAFKHLDATAPNYIKLHGDVAPAKFTLPTGISELTIMSDSTTRTITLPRITSLAPSFKFYLDDVNIVSAGASSLTINARNDFNLSKVSFAPVTSISVAANHEIFMQGSISGVGKLRGTSTSKLTIYESTDVSEITNFDTVWIPATDPVKVSGRVSGINTMDGKLRMLSADKANTAVIKKAEGTLSLAYNNGAVTKATVTEVTGLLKVEVYDEGTDTLTKLPSGIPILTAGGTANLTDHLWIDNKDAANHTLDAYAYNREIRAEYSGALTLNGTDDYPNFEKAFENLVENADNTIELHTDIAPAKFALPAKKITKLSIIGDGAHDYDKRNIKLPKVTSLAPAYELFLKKVSFYSEGATSFAINAKGDLDFENVDFFPTANISVPANHSITLAGEYCTGIGRVSGTNSSSLIVQDNVFVNEAANFKRVSITNGKTFRVFGRVSGVDTLDKGTLRLSTSGTAVASVIKTVDNAGIVLEYSETQNAVLSKLTINDVTTKLNVKLLSYPSYALSSLPSGTPILTAGGTNDYTARVTVENKDDGTNPLKAYLYNKEIRAEDPMALDLNGKSYPSFEKAFENLTDGNNTITLYKKNAPAKFALPTKKMNSLTIDGQGYLLELPKVASLTPAYELTLKDLSIKNVGASSLTINAKKDLTLTLENVYCFDTTANVSAPANSTLYLKNTVKGLGKVSGTATSELNASNDVTVNEIATFGYVSTSVTAVIKVSGKVSGVNKLDGNLRMLSADKANTAVIKDVAGYSNLSLAYKDSAVTKTTITGISGSLRITVYDEGTDTPSKLTSGTPVLFAGGSANFTDKITITNSDPDGHSLDAYYYNKEIRAEYPSALTLNGTPYQNLEKAFENVAVNADNTIVLYTDLAPAKFALPTKKINSLTIKGDGTIRTLTLPKVTSLAPAYALTLENVNIVSSGAASLTISAKENVTLTSVTFDPVPTISLAANKSLSIEGTTGLINKVSGTATSDLYVYNSVRINEIANVGTVWTDPSNAFIRVSGKVSGVNVFEGHLRMGSADKASSVTIKEVRGNSTLRLAHKDNVIPKATITNVTGTLQITVNEEGTSILSAIPSGFPILTAGGTTDFTDKITIKNQAAGNKPLTAHKYNKEIRAEYDWAVSLTIPSVGTFTSPDLNGIFEVIRNRPDSEEGTYKITVNTDIYAGKFTLPAKVDWLNITGAGTLPRTVTMVATSSLAPKYDMSLIGIKLENINANGVPTAFSISQSTGDLWLHEFVSETLSGITGTNNSKLALRDTATIDKISGFKLVNILSGNYTVGKTFSTTNLFIGAGSTITVPDGCTITAANITCEGTGGLIKLEPGFKPLTIKGTSPTAINGTIKLVSDSPIEDDVQILNSAGCPLGNFDVTGIKGGSSDYCLTRTGAKVYCRKAVFTMDYGKYATFADMVAEIERVKDPARTYEIRLLSDHDAGGALKFPRAGTCGEIKVMGNNYTLSFTGNLSLTGNTSLNTVTLRSVNAAGVSAAYTMTVTNGDLSASGVNFGDITAITAANRKIDLNVVTLGSKPVKIAAKEYSFMTVTGMIDSLTVDTIAATGSTKTQNTLYMLFKKQSRVNVGIKSGSQQIILKYRKADGSMPAFDTPEFPIGTVLFSVFKGEVNTDRLETDPCGYTRDAGNRLLAGYH